MWVGGPAETSLASHGVSCHERDAGGEGCPELAVGRRVGQCDLRVSRNCRGSRWLLCEEAHARLPP